MKKDNTPNLFKPEYLLDELLNILKNDPKSAPRLMENLLNIDYDFENQNGFYKILNEDQREIFRRIHLLRKKDEKFDQQFQTWVMLISLGVGVGYGVAKLIEHLDEKGT